MVLSTADLEGTASPGPLAGLPAPGRDGGGATLLSSCEALGDGATPVEHGVPLRAPLRGESRRRLVSGTPLLAAYQVLLAEVVQVLL